MSLLLFVVEHQTYLLCFVIEQLKVVHRSLHLLNLLLELLMQQTVTKNNRFRFNELTKIPCNFERTNWTSKRVTNWMKVRVTDRLRVAVQKTMERKTDAETEKKSSVCKSWSVNLFCVEVLSAFTTSFLVCKSSTLGQILRV